MADIRDVTEHGLECISKSTEPEQPGYKNRYILRTSATGTFTPTGLGNGLANNTFEITDVASAIPISPLSNRNSLILRNHSANIVYIGGPTVTAGRNIGSTTDGFEVDGNSSFSIDIRSTTLSTLYGICEAGKTALCKTLELA
jgi:hypothetical protein